MLNALLFTLLPFVANPGFPLLCDLLLRKLFPNLYESKIRVILLIITYFISLGMILFVPDAVDKFAIWRESV
jgi:hypothetical protein